MASEGTSVCEGCGATIYREHIDAGIARYEAGKMLCPHCVEDFESSHDASSSGVASDDELAPIAFDDDEDAGARAKRPASETRIQAFGAAGGIGGGKWDEGRFQRQLEPEKESATRCRTFHSKLNDGAISFMTDQINDWLDQSPEIRIKFATSTIGIFEGKHPEPNLIMTLFY